MDAQTIIAKRIALELRDGITLNPRNRIPTQVANYVPAVFVCFSIGEWTDRHRSVPEQGMAGDATDAGGSWSRRCPVRAALIAQCHLPRFGADTSTSPCWAACRSIAGRLANWVIPNKMVPGMGGAMDLSFRCKRVIVAMQHTAKGSKIVKWLCALGLQRAVDLVVTELAVSNSTTGRRRCREQHQAFPLNRSDKPRSSSSLPERVPEMQL